VALFPIYGVLTVEQSLLQQPNGGSDSTQTLLSCETKALDDVPPDPVSLILSPPLLLSTMSVDVDEKKLKREPIIMNEFECQLLSNI
jgi:hypothetical protein